MSAILAINWGSSAVRAMTVAADGSISRLTRHDKGVNRIDREQIPDLLDTLIHEHDVDGPCYLAGMIGSRAGWEEAPYGRCPAGHGDLAGALRHTSIGAHKVTIIPGLKVEHADGRCDILRGEEVELFGALVCEPFPSGSGRMILPGTHTKVAEVKDGRVVNFMTAMGGELFDGLARQGLLSVFLRSGESRPGPAFEAGLDRVAQSGQGLASLLFEVRARVICGALSEGDAASYTRGLIVAAELLDAECLFGPFDPRQETLIIGNPGLSALHRIALARRGGVGRVLEAEAVSAAGFQAIHKAIGVPA